MDLPSEVPVMTLPNAILFPQAMLPLYIFEPRYRQMLTDSLNSHRMFTVAMLKPGRTREIPSPIAGLGLIRASVSGKDGTSHLILQGLARVELTETVRYKPYRIHRIRHLQTTGTESGALETLTSKVLELVVERLDQGFEMPVHIMQKLATSSDEEAKDRFSLKEVVHHLVKIDNPDHLADLVSCTLLSDPSARQMILATPDLDNRLRHLAHFLSMEIRRNRKA
jgi:Lon protease-like protein